VARGRYRRGMERGREREDQRSPRPVPRARIVERRPLARDVPAGEPTFEPGSFIPTLFSVRDGANGEFGNTRAISTWLYATLERPPSARSWLLTLAYVLGTVIVELWILSKVRS